MFLYQGDRRANFNNFDAWKYINNLRNSAIQST